MDWLTAEFVQALGVAVATIVGAVSAWQAREVRRLRTRVEALETQLAANHARFRAALKVIRGLLRHIDTLTAFVHVRTGEQPPANPVVIPPVLEQEL
ncbi:hypothetical protein [Nocardia brasiliensis]|uniref:hypothetical protein n=1 Tax=Nocardia brasiliensis TaxID=37326 RepID=UPI0024554D56|nr:hypothetical protein [Nocardia brasiliensis]